jgi:putative membrane protein
MVRYTEPLGLPLEKTSPKKWGMKWIRQLAVGAVGGLAGAAMMGYPYLLVAKLMPKPVTQSEDATEEDATEKVADALATKLTGRKLDRPQRKVGGQFVHFGFGAATGALYGLLASRFPKLRRGWGALWGIAVYAGAHSIVVPALGLAPSPLSSGLAREGPELAAHLFYGVVTESARRALS